MILTMDMVGNPWTKTILPLGRDADDNTTTQDDGREFDGGIGEGNEEPGRGAGHWGGDQRRRVMTQQRRARLNDGGYDPTTEGMTQ